MHSFRQEDFAQFKRLCEEHFREEEEVTLPALRHHFTPAEVQPVAKKISKMYSLLDMGESVDDFIGISRRSCGAHLSFMARDWLC